MLDKNILITGITGFVGSHFADFVAETFKHVKIYATKRYHLSKLDNVSHLIRTNKIIFHDCDLTDPVSVNDLIKSVKPGLHFSFCLQRVLLVHPGNTPTDICQ